MNADQPIVYDKAKYHSEFIEEQGLPEEHAYNHTTFFMSWLVKNRLMSDFFESESKDEVEKYRSGQTTINQLYEWWDCCLVSDMLSERGNAFARSYFDFENGSYLSDYEQYLKKNLPSEFHVPYTADNERVIHQVIKSRYEEWNRLQS